MGKRLKQPAKGRNRRQPPGAAKGRFKPRGFSFKREGELLSLMNVAPFVIGIFLALLFWFTR